MTRDFERRAVATAYSATVVLPAGEGERRRGGGCIGGGVYG